MSVLVPVALRSKVSQDFANTFSNTQNMYFLFSSKHTTYPDGDSIIPDIADTTQVFYDVYQNMIQGKRITSNDVCPMIPRYEYESKIYDRYDDSDLTLFSKQFYTVVNAGSFYHVFKCLDNNKNNISVIEPNFAEVDADDNSYQTSDNYVWKYMFSVDSTTVSTFGTVDYFPVVANTTVKSHAVDGSIDSIFVDIEGKNYSNYTKGMFISSDLRKDGNSQIYAINAEASSTNGYYSNCYIYITSGTGVGQYKRITNYYANATSKNIVIESQFLTAPQIDSRYDIYPGVVVTGSGSQTSNVVARGIINATAGNTIYRIQIIERGANYTYANAYVSANPVVGVTQNAVIRAVYSPRGGHGYDAESELGASRLGIGLTFSNNESNTILETNDYRYVGIIKNPRFSNVNITLSNTSGGLFLPSETLYKIEPVLVRGTANIASGNTAVTAADGQFTMQFNAGDRILLEVANDSHQLATINGIANNTQLTLTTNATFTSNSGDIYIPTITTSGLVDNASAGSVYLQNVIGTFATGDYVIGATSGAFGQVNVISRHGTTKAFTTFIQLDKFDITPISGTFTQDEVVFVGGIDQSNAILHSVNNGILYLTNRVGEFLSTNTIIGSTSGAIALITNKYTPELVFGSGELIHLEYISPITRQNNQSESFKVILDF